QSDQNDEPDLDQDISVKTSHVHANHGGQDAHWNDENHSERQNPALIKSGEQQEYKDHRQAKGYDRSISRELLLQRDLGPLECKAARQTFFGNSLGRGDALAGLRDKLSCTSAAGKRLYRGSKRSCYIFECRGRADRHHFSGCVTRL